MTGFDTMGGFETMGASMHVVSRMGRPMRAHP